MKYLRLFKKASDYETAKSALDVPNVSLVEETQECHFIGGGDDTVIRLYKTNCTEDGEYRNEIDYEEWFELLGTKDIDGQTYYQWGKHYWDDFQELNNNNNFGILTETTDYSAASINNPLPVAGFIYKGNIDNIDNALTYSHDDDEIVLSVEAPKRIINKYPEKHNTSALNKNGQAYVDLGLPSGTLWAKCNVGATKESDYGGYYQWGGTVDYTSTAKTCGWSTYPYGTSSTALTKYNTMTHYGTVDNKTVLDLSDDVAHQVMGGDWHMPSVLHINELLANTTSEWTAVDGINGRRFTSKLNGNSIFIPAAGRRAGRSLDDAGGFCYLWSSSLYLHYPVNAYLLYSLSGGCGINHGTSRCFGFSVRGVLY